MDNYLLIDCNIYIVGIILPMDAVTDQSCREVGFPRPLKGLKRQSILVQYTWICDNKQFKVKCLKQKWH